MAAKDRCLFNSIMLGQFFIGKLQCKIPIMKLHHLRDFLAIVEKKVSAQPRKSSVLNNHRRVAASASFKKKSVCGYLSGMQAARR